jgi:phosphohistidine phosphatase
MNIYLAQHGNALDKQVDPDRPLSESGVADVQLMAGFLIGRMHADRIVHSGKTRARQTAELLGVSVSPGVAPEMVDGIAPNDPVEAFAEQLASWEGNILVVGHLPFLARLVTLLIGGDPDTPVVTYQPGSIVHLTSDDEDGWRISWMITPELLVDNPAGVT